MATGAAVEAMNKANSGRTKMRLRFKATHVVLAMLCVMYFITYIDRVNISTAASEIQKELHLSNTQLGLVFSAFAYPYLLFQVIGGWVGDRFGPRKTLFWCGMIWAASTIMTGFVNSLLTLFIARVALGFGEGATFPTATRAMQYWTPAGKRGFAQGITHAFARLGNAITPPLIAALMFWLTWRGSFVALGLVSLLWGRDLGRLFPQRAQGSSRNHRGRTGVASATPRQYAASGTLGRAVAPDVAGHADLFLLRLEPVAVPELAAAVLQEQLQPGYQEFGAVRLGRVLCRRRRRQPGGNFVRPDSEEDRQRPLRAVERHDHRLRRRAAVAAADPVHPRHHHRRSVPVGGLFLRRTRHRPDVVGADGHRAEIFRYRRRPDEYRLGAGGDRFAFGGRLRDRCDRQLVLAVPDVDGTIAARRVFGVPDASGVAVRGRRRRDSVGWTARRGGINRPPQVRDPPEFGFARQSLVSRALQGKAWLLMH